MNGELRRIGSRTGSPKVTYTVNFVNLVEEEWSGERSSPWYLLTVFLSCWSVSKRRTLGFFYYHL